MKRIGALIVTILAFTNTSLATTFQGIKLDNQPLKCSLTVIGQQPERDLTCIFLKSAPDSVKVIYPASLQEKRKSPQTFHFESNHGKIFGIDRVAIYPKMKGKDEKGVDEHNFNIYGVLNVIPPDAESKK
ncbi:hypothetical protein SOPP22_09050 [Shewanella sp. OPT22]|nr:hypothetical protein SOPP22_09050 [Shewanella sp. OPT22]